MFRSLRLRIAVPDVALILAATLGLTVYLSGKVRQVRLDGLEARLFSSVRLLANSAEPLLDGASPGAPDFLVRDGAELLEARVTVIGADGVIVDDSHEAPAVMYNHLNRPEVQLALASGEGSSRRYSATLGYEMMYAAVPIRGEPDGSDDGPILGIARLALPVDEIEAGVSRLRWSITLAGGAMALAAALLVVLLVWRTTQHLRELTAVAQRMASGDLDARLMVWGHDEVGQVGRAFNHMADQIREQISTLAAEQGRLAAVLEHMADGVLLTDDSGRVRLSNAAAARILDTTEERALGRTFAQVAPYHALIELWKACREQGHEQLQMVEVSQQGLFLSVIVTPFAEGGNDGYVVILQDLTRIRRLETVRRDFISNISHELRTPLAGLKALVDTLRGGAIKDRPAAKRFLKRMDGEVDALTQLAEELLELTRIGSGQVPLRLAPTQVAVVVIPPVDRLRPQAERAGLELTVLLPPGVPPVLADAVRAQLVLTNLVHNAVKFTPPGGSITVGVKVAGAARDSGGWPSRWAAWA